jgi:hypothetical protein
MVRTDAFIRTRKLSSQEVARINYVLKARARRYIAAGRREWLYPEESVAEPWGELRKTLLPPKDELWHFGGELYAKFQDGRVYYQDELGRTEKQRDFLKKDPPTKPRRPRDVCGCGSGRSFKACCEPKPIALRPTWNERSIRERNLMLQNGVVNVLGLNQAKDWVSVRRDLTDEQISKIYLLCEGLWPLETDFLSLLPKPDGLARAVYTGPIHPTTITDFALGATLYFGELIIQHSFLHAGTVKKEFSPVENPTAYRQEFLKTVIFFLTVMPLVELGLVNLIPDPCNFDAHLRDQMLHMAESRSAGMAIDQRKEPRMQQLMKEDLQRSLMSLPRDALGAQLLKAPLGLDGVSLEEVRYIEQLKGRDPLAALQEDSLPAGEKGGQLNLVKLVPNFEMATYLAQATGACIVTDSPFRWTEIKRAIRQRAEGPYPGLASLAHNIESSEFAFPQNLRDIAAFAFDRTFAAYPALIGDIFKYLSNLDDRGPKPNREAQLTGRFAKAHAPVQTAIKKTRIPTKEARISCVFPSGGIQDNAVNRLLLMSSSEGHLPSVPRAFFIEERMAD